MEKKAPVKVNSRRILAYVATVAAAAAALLLFLYRDYLSPSGLRDLLGVDSGNKLEAGEAFTYEASSSQAFARVGNGLAVSSSTGIALLDTNGRTVVKQIFSMSTPAIAGTRDKALFFDIGGTAMSVASLNGECINLDTSSPIISATINDSGYIAATTEGSGYKAHVIVYNGDCSLAWERFFGAEYVLRSHVSPDSRSVAVLSIGSAGSRIGFFPLSSETERSAALFQDELIIDFSYISDDKLCAISEKRILFFDSTGKITGEYGFGDNYLAGYDFDGNGFFTLYLVKYRSGSEGILVSVDASGEVLGEISVRQDLLSLSSQGKSILVLYSDRLIIYSHKLVEAGSYDDTLGAKKAILRERGDSMVLSLFSAEIYSFGH